MKFTLLIIFLLTLCWHLGIFWISQFTDFHQADMAFGGVLRLVELDLLKALHGKLKKLPSRRLDTPPYSTWLGETQYWIGRIEERGHCSR